MAYELYIGDKVRIEDRLNGGAILGPFPSNGLPIGGLTLDFTSPAAVTVTFTGAAGEHRTWAQILADLITQIATCTSRTRPASNGPVISNGGPGGSPANQLNLSLQADAGVTIAETGTANAMLGIATDAPTAYPAMVDQAEIVSLSQGSTPAHYAVLINLVPTP